MSRLIRDIFEDSVNRHSSQNAVKWLIRKDIHEITYSELGIDVKKIRYSFENLGFYRTHMALIGKSSL